MHRQRFLQTFLQTPRCAGVNAFQLPEDFLQLGLGRRVRVTVQFYFPWPSRVRTRGRVTATFCPLKIT